LIVGHRQQHAADENESGEATGAKAPLQPARTTRHTGHRQRERVP
jgi:hypothetical protein